MKKPLVPKVAETPDPTVITLTELRKPEIVQRGKLLRERFLITDHGKPMAMLVPVETKENPGV